MSNHCHSGTCGSGSHHMMGSKHHHGCGSGGCCSTSSCCQSSCGCCSSSGKGSCCSQESECCDMAEELLKLADCAWMELLKEKIKERILSQDQQTLDQLAQIVCEANKEKWKAKTCEESCCIDYEKRIQDVFKQKNHSNNK